MTNAATASVPTIRPCYESAQTDMGNNALRVNVEGKAERTYTTDRNPGPNPDARHPWEQAGLGVAPYRLVGAGSMTYQACRDAPVQPGASCDYCGQGIVQVYFIRAACGSMFHVGCDCVRKSCSKVEGVRTRAEAIDRKHRNDLARAASARRDAATKDRLAVMVAEHADRLASMPHPRADKGEFFAAKTFMDYVQWMLANCGAMGRKALAKEVEKALAAH